MKEEWVCEGNRRRLCCKKESVDTDTRKDIVNGDSFVQKTHFCGNAYGLWF
jgi:hypothetical protein